MIIVLVFSSYKQLRHRNAVSPSVFDFLLQVPLTTMEATEITRRTMVNLTAISDTPGSGKCSKCYKQMHGMLYYVKNETII